MSVWDLCRVRLHRMEVHDVAMAAPLGFVNMTSAIIGSTLNILVLLAIWRTPSLQTPSRILLCSLALSDLLTGMLAQVVFTIFLASSIERNFDVYCITGVASNYFGYLFTTLSVTTLALISIDRFLAIKLKIAYKPIVTVRRVILVLIGIWVFLTVLGIFLFNQSNTLRNAVVGAGLALGLFLVTVFYTMAFRMLRNHSRQVDPTNQNEVQIQQQQSSVFNILVYKKSLQTMVIILGVILLSYLPFLCYSVISLLAFKREETRGYISSTLVHICETFATSNSACNPVLYLWRMRDLRAAVRNMLRGGTN